MLDLGKYTFEILSAYAVTIVPLSWLAYIYFMRARRLSRIMKEIKKDKKV